MESGRPVALSRGSGGSIRIGRNLWRKLHIGIDAARIDRYVRHKAHEPSSEEAFSRFPTWMWRNVEMHDFVDWLRGHNE